MVGLVALIHFPGAQWGPYSGRNPSPPSDRSRKPTTYPQDELGVVDDTVDRKPNGKTGFPTYSRPMSGSGDAEPQCHSKVQQRIGAVSCRKPPIETQIAVINTAQQARTQESRQPDHSNSKNFHASEVD